MVWESEDQDYDVQNQSFFDSIFGQRFNSAGETVEDEFLISTRLAGSYYDDSDPAVAGLDGGCFAVAWDSYQYGSSYGVFARVFDDEGDAIGGEFRANDFRSYSYTYQEDAAVSRLSDGGFVVVWKSEEQGIIDYNNEVFGRRFNVFGDTVGDDFINGGFESGPTR